MFTLYELKDDSIATIEKIVTTNQLKLRLAELGIMPGMEVRMIKKSPFKGPVQIKINNYYLTLRKEDAILIHLTNISNNEASS